MASLPVELLAASFKACLYRRILPQTLRQLRNATNAKEPDLEAMAKLAHQAQVLAAELDQASHDLIVRIEAARCAAEDVKTAEIVRKLRDSGWMKSNVVQMRGVR